MFVSVSTRRGHVSPVSDLATIERVLERHETSANTFESSRDRRSSRHQSYIHALKLQNGIPNSVVGGIGRRRRAPRRALPGRARRARARAPSRGRAQSALARKAGALPPALLFDSALVSPTPESDGFAPTRVSQHDRGAGRRDPRCVGSQTHVVSRSFSSLACAPEARHESPRRDLPPRSADEADAAPSRADP